MPDPSQPGMVCSDGSEPRDPQVDRRVRDILGLDEADEAHPLSAYDIGCDEGSWSAFLRKLWCGAQALPFALGKWAVGVGIDLMGWALEFRIAESLAPLAGLLSRIYDTSLIGPLGIRHLAWTLALFVVGWHLLRARVARGATELATTFLVAVVGGILIANPQGYLEGAIALAKNSSGAVLEAIDDTIGTDGSDGSARGADAVRDRIGDVLRRSFVAEPYDLINWGESLSGDCARARDEILEGGPWGGDDRPREIMRDAGCDRQADFNERPSDNRAAASLIVALAAVAATVLLVCIALVVFVAQLTLVALFAGASLVWAVALFPGARPLLAWWVGRLIWAIAATVGATFVLSWLAVTVTAALTATEDLSIIQRCLVALLVVVFGFRLRGHISRATETATRRVGDRLTRAAGQEPWPAAATGGLFGGSGAGLAALGRSWAFDMPGGQLLYYRAYVRVFTRGYRPKYRHGHHRDDSRHGGRRRQQAGWTDLPRDRSRAMRAISAAAPVLGHHAYTGAVRAHTRVTMASEQVRARIREARAVHQQRARQTGRAVQVQRDVRREATNASHQAGPTAQPPPGVTEHRVLRRPRASDPTQDQSPAGPQAHRADQLPPGATERRVFPRRRDPAAPQDQSRGGREARRADQLPPGVTEHRLFRRPRDPDPPDWK